LGIAPIQKSPILRAQLQPGDGSACFGVDQQGFGFIRAIEMNFAPLAQRNDDKKQAAPLLGQDILFVGGAI